MIRKPPLPLKKQSGPWVSPGPKLPFVSACWHPWALSCGIRSELSVLMGAGATVVTQMRDLGAHLSLRRAPRNPAGVGRLAAACEAAKA
eukprot:3340406-Alexandrium_andersonii.AAC.1